MKAKLVGDIVNMLDYGMNEQASISLTQMTITIVVLSRYKTSKKVVPKFKETF
jgi:hypothetical protein